MQLITEIPFTGTGDTTNYADDYLIKTCTGASNTIESVGSPVRIFKCGLTTAHVYSNHVILLSLF